jgi:hypothetical protein
MRPMTPGRIQSNTAAPNAMRVLRSPLEKEPSFRRSSAMYSPAPETFLISGRFRAIKITHSATNMTATMGNAARTQSKKEMIVSVWS